MHGSPEADRPTPGRPKVSAAFIETVLAGLLFLWRAWIMRPAELAQDIPAIVALYWLVLRFVRNTRAALPVTLVFIAGLLTLAAVGQAPHTWAMLRTLR